MVTFAIVSYQVRRDLHDPLRFFEVLKPIHFYQGASYRDMDARELEGAYRYSNPLDLLAKLRQAQPQIVQGGEPFVRRLVPYGWAVLAYSQSHRRPYVVPSLDNIPVAAKYGDLWAAAVRRSVGKYVREACLAIAVNAGAESNLRWAGARPERIKRMMYGTWGVDTDEFSPDGPRAPLAEEEPVIMFVGRLERGKGVFQLVEATAKVLRRMPLRLVVVGDGPDAQRLRGAATAAGLGDRVRFTGTILNKDVPSYLRSASLLVAPSLSTTKWAEQVGMSAIQALACGVPVVSTVSGSIPEFIDDGVSGLLVPENDADALATAILRLLSDPELRSRMSLQAREEAARRFDAARNVRIAEREILQACRYR